VERLKQNLPDAKRFFDVNLRPQHWTMPLMRELLSIADVVKLNVDEVAELAPLFGLDGASVQEFCRACIREYGCEVVCVTQGENGCALQLRDDFVTIPGFKVQVADTIGSGDAFAAALLHGLDQRWDPERIGRFANAAGALVASKAGANPDWTVADCERLSVVVS
jgi:fructokinase